MFCFCCFFIFIWNLKAKLQGNGVIVIHLEDINGYYEKTALLLTLKNFSHSNYHPLTNKTKPKKPSTHDV